MSASPRLRCTECGADAAAATTQVCERCFGPLAFDHGWEARRGTVARRDLDPVSRDRPADMWRWSPLLPVAAPDVPASVGATPLVAARALGEALGIPDLWLKDETANPSGSFKDRVVSTALARARAQGQRVAACASTGNLARSVALLAPAFGMLAVVLVPEQLDAARVAALRSLGAVIARVSGPYDAANRLSVEAAMHDEFEAWAWVNVTLRPWYVEGAATIGYEIAEQLGWRAPDHVVTPAASGSMACQTIDALGALATLGLLEDGSPARLSVAQPGGCAPIAAAFDAGASAVAPVQPDTVASSVAMGDPPEGPAVLARARTTGGAVVAVPEAAIAGASALVTERTGIAVEPAGGVVAGGLELLVQRGVVTPEQRVVAVLTGGLPALEPVAVPGPPAVTMQPTLAALVDALSHLASDHPPDQEGPS